MELKGSSYQIRELGSLYSNIIFYFMTFRKVKPINLSSILNSYTLTINDCFVVVVTAGQLKLNMINVVNKVGTKTSRMRRE